MAKGVRLLDKKAIFVYTGKIVQIRAFERYIALKENGQTCTIVMMSKPSSNLLNFPRKCVSKIGGQYV